MSAASRPDPKERVPKKTALTNVRVFDGRRLREPDSVVIDGALIGTDKSGAQVIDGRGATLLPGLIDAHVHLSGVETLERLADFGVTTALDMATWPAELVDSLRGRVGLTDIRSCGTSATSPGSLHSRIFPDFPKSGLLAGPAEAPRFVADRVAEGSDYIKIIADIPGPDQATMNALVAAAREHGKLTVVHASSFATFRMALEAGADMITHAPRDQALDEETVSRMVADRRVAIPTLAMMEGVAAFLAAAAPPGVKVPGADYGASRASVGAMYRAGVPILAGTDANSTPGSPFSPPHGESLHHELELLVDAGLSTLDALRAATSLPALHFGLHDRGSIEPGRRADLVLIEGDPLQDISATRNLQRIWCGGHERVRP
ncbi:MAG: amidohydrolase family protein [Candidatus Dormibacteraeota bacterium]|nr:amidohydrolase family protein [Candidatus Dormibacteraeota bacterium]